MYAAGYSGGFSNGILCCIVGNGRKPEHGCRTEEAKLSPDEVRIDETDENHSRAV